MKLYCIGSNLIRRHLLYCVNNFIVSYNIEKYIYELILYKYYYIILLYILF